MLSQSEQDELTDHLYLETEALQEQGLSIEEAFLISEKRLGKVEMIEEEYQKAKPWTHFLQFLIPGMLTLLSLKIIFNLVSISSLSAAALVSHFSWLDLTTYIQWGDLALQSVGTGCFVGMAAFWIKNQWGNSSSYLWLLPLFFLLTELLQFAILRYATETFLSLPLLGAIKLHAAYVYAGFIGLGVMFSTWVLFRFRGKSMHVQTS